MSEKMKKKPEKTQLQAAWIGIKARRRAEKGMSRPLADPLELREASSKQTNGRARLFQILSDTQTPEKPQEPQRKMRTVKVEKVTTREARKRALILRHADAIEKLKARKALAAQRDALVKETLDSDDFGFPAEA